MPQFPPRSVDSPPSPPATAPPGEPRFLVQVAHACRLRHLAVGWHGLRLCEGRGPLDARHALPQSRQCVPLQKSLPFSLRVLYGRATRPAPKKRLSKPLVQNRKADQSLRDTEPRADAPVGGPEPDPVGRARGGPGWPLWGGWHRLARFGAYRCALAQEVRRDETLSTRTSSGYADLLGAKPPTP